MGRGTIHSRRNRGQCKLSKNDNAAWTVHSLYRIPAFKLMRFESDKFLCAASASAHERSESRIAISQCRRIASSEKRARGLCTENCRQTRGFRSAAVTAPRAGARISDVVNCCQLWRPQAGLHSIQKSLAPCWWRRCRRSMPPRWGKHFEHRHAEVDVRIYIEESNCLRRTCRWQKIRAGSVVHRQTWSHAPSLTALQLGSVCRHRMEKITGCGWDNARIIRQLRQINVSTMRAVKLASIDGNDFFCVTSVSQICHVVVLSSSVFYTRTNNDWSIHDGIQFLHSHYTHAVSPLLH